MSDIVGRADCGRDLERMVDRLREGHGGATVLFGEPGIGKTSLLAAMAAYAKSLDLCVKHWRRLPGDAAPWDTDDGVLLVMDDLHRLPGHFAPALEALIERTASRPILLAIAHRPRQLTMEVAAALFRATSAGTLHSQPVGPLTLAEAREMLGDRPGLGSIHRDGQGNPAYMRMLAAGSPDTSDAAGIFSAELAQLNEAELRVARLAAVLGDPFSPDLLAAVAAAAPARTLAVLDALVARDLIRPAEPAPLLAFRHPVLAGVVYHRIAVSQRRSMHRRIEAELGRQAGSEERRAFHIARAADPAQVDTLLSAARRFTDSHPREAVDWLAVALTLISETDDRWCEAQLLLARAKMLTGQPKDSRDALHALLARQPAVGAAVTAAALVLSSEVERLLGNYREADAFARLAATASLGAERSAPKGATRLGDGLAARLRQELAEHAIEALRFEAAVRHATIAARHARRRNDHVGEIRALSLAALAEFSHGRPAMPEATIARATRGADAMSDATLLRDLSCLSELARVEAMLGNFSDAERHTRRAIALSRQSGQSHMLPAILKTLGQVQFRLGQLPEALETLDLAARSAHGTDTRPIQALIAAIRSNTLVWLRTGTGTAEAVDAAREALSACDGYDTAFAVVVRGMVAETLIHAGEPDRGARLALRAAGGAQLPRLAGCHRPQCWDLLVDAEHLARGGHEIAEEYARLANVHVGRWPSPTRRGYAERAAARVHRMRGNPRRAIEAGQAALRHFDACEARLEAARTLLLIADTCLDHQLHDGVADRLDRAAELAAACGSPRLAEQVAVARQRLGAPASALAQLTARESQVAELVSTGLTNGQIAARLRLSVRTVDCHLARVYHKLGVPNRAGLTRLLARG